METTAKRMASLKVNGKVYQLELAANETLLDVLRDRLGLTGTKFGCGNAECGACTVLLEGRAVNSCIVFALECEGLPIETIEGLRGADGELHPIQKAFMDNFGVQCGFCTPGMIMAAKSILDDNPDPTELEVREAIDGNICRCTGYDSIVDSVLAAGRLMRGGS